MSKATIKCPSCGKQVQAAMRYCGWCGFDLKVGNSERVDSLPRPGQKAEQKPVSQPAQQPVQQSAQQPAAQVEKAQPTAPRQPMREPEQKPVQPQKRTPAKKPNPAKPVPQQKPVNRNRRPASKTANNAVPPHKKNTGTVIAILAAAAIIVIIAVILIIRMNASDSQPTPPDNTADVHVMNANGEETPDVSNTPAATDKPEDTAEPDATDAPTPTQEPEDINGTVYVTGSGVNLRSGPGTTYDVIESLTRGTELERTGTTNGWSRVIYNGEECYISSALISTEKPEDLEEPEQTPAAEQPEETPAPEQSDTPATAVSDTVVVRSSAHIRSGPGTDNSSLGIVAAGTELERTGVSGDWSRVKYNGQEGYISNNLITEKGAEGTVTIVSKANIRSGPGTSYDILGTEDVGTVLTKKDHTASNWYEVDYNGQTGYIAGNMVKEN